MKNSVKSKKPEKTGFSKSVKINGFRNKDDKNTEKTVSAYKEWIKYKCQT